jgi:hypothetical protein
MHKGTQTRVVIIAILEFNSSVSLSYRLYVVYVSCFKHCVMNVGTNQLKNDRSSYDAKRSMASVASLNISWVS